MIDIGYSLTNMTWLNIDGEEIDISMVDDMDEVNHWLPQTLPENTTGK